MPARLLIVILLCLTAAPAGAGPWPRAPGTGFVSFTAGAEDLRLLRTQEAGLEGLRLRMEPAAEFYGEYGLSERIVLGLHLRRAEGRLRRDLLARWHPRLPGPVALGLTLGARLGVEGGRRAEPFVAAHLGYGTETRIGNIWARAGLQAVGNPEGLRGIAEVEISGQVGLRMGWGGLAMLTLSEHRDGFGRMRKLTPALGYAVTARSTLVLGATVLPQARRLDGLQLSFWRDF